MKKIKFLFIVFLGVAVALVSCKVAHNTQRNKNSATAQKSSNNAALGAIIGAAVGGSTGYVIGKKMDVQAQEIKAQVPGTKVERKEEGIEVEFLSRNIFASDQFNLTDSSKKILDNLIIILHKYPQTNMEVQGHTDNTGTENYNMTLSVKRATAVANYLKANGVAASRIAVKGFGESHPKYDNTTPEGRAHNRRVEILITANQQMKAEAAQEAKTSSL